MSDRIELKSVGDILGMNFYIPKYQRGYRWTKQQVIDLLNDIKEFMERTPGDDEIYCLQPLVVKKKDDDTFKRIKEEATNLIEVEALLKGSWDVIDGQQRLTTIKILLSCLDEKESYNIEYETRKYSKEFFAEISNDGALDKFGDNIDFYHMNQAKKTIQTWFENNGTSSFKETLLNKVKFIWYESTDEDPIRVFTRLNIGKIPLTDAELIKALFLNQSNFSHGENTENIRLYQQEIAAEWDNIEYTLQNDEFWLFIHSPEWNKPTRIDFIFDLMRKKECFGKIEEKCVGEDEHKSFRYFYEYFKAKKKTIDGSKLRDEIWRKVKEYFQIFQEWYNDLELYHYVGYVIENGWRSTGELIEIWKNKIKKEDFIAKIKKEITEKMPQVNSLTQEYEISGKPKTQCRPLLLLFNIQTVINQNRELVNSDKYGVGTFYKFPFHLFKKEGKKVNGKGWEIEHIASNAGDDLTKLESQKIFLASIKYSYELKDELKKRINEFINGTEGSFEELRNSVWEECESKNSIPDDKKNYIWNFALLDSTTNEEYQNDPFPVKRICVLAKEQGKKARLGLNENGSELKITYENGIAFVPACTRNVFTKAYTEIPTALNSWTLDDAVHYLKKMNEVLWGAGFIPDQTEEIEKFIKDSNSTEKNNG